MNAFFKPTLALALVLSSIAFTLSAQTARDPAPRTIDIDCTAVKGPRSMTYQQCVGAGRVAEGLRAEWQAQLKTCQQEIGFHYLRCHGLLHDELNVYREDKDGHAIYDFTHIDVLYDYLVSIHMRPFVEIGFMPEDLASIRADDPNPPDVLDRSGTKRTVTVFWWKANVTPPKSYDKWDALIVALVRHWTERYGAKEVSQWYFEIWNEPDHHAFFSPTRESTRQAEYFTLYAHTAQDVKSVDPAYRVGGPAATGSLWVAPLIAYCQSNHVPLDFVSFHAYGGTKTPGRKKAAALAFDATGHTPLYLASSLRLPSEKINSVKGPLAKSAMPQLPVEITEWSASSSNHDPVHDSYFEAPYILENLKQTESMGCMSYWTFTDIFEESGPPKTPFAGGFGLINLQGIKKPAFFAYAFLNRLGTDELVNHDARSWVCRGADGGVQALFWDLTDPTGDHATDNWIVFRKVQVPSPKGSVALRLKNLKPGRYRLTVSRVGFEKNDAYTAYLKMGLPDKLTTGQVTDLQALASGKPEEEMDIAVDASGTWQRDFPVRENDVVLARLEPLP